MRSVFRAVEFMISRFFFRRCAETGGNVNVFFMHIAIAHGLDFDMINLIYLIGSISSPADRVRFGAVRRIGSVRSHKRRK
jgi:hypothetical protein